MIAAWLAEWRNLSRRQRVLIVVVIIFGLLYAYGSTLPKEQTHPVRPGSTDLIRQECEARYLDPALVDECVRRTHEAVRDAYDF